MCRLMALSTTGLDMAIMKRLFFHQMLLASNAEGQQDGTGITDGITVMKSVWPFVDYGAQWIRQLNADTVWLGHVRSASRNMEISSRSAHPFAFNVGQNKLIAAHNGFIRHVIDVPLDASEPRVDSFRAFKLLIPALESGGELTPETINAWTAQFGQGSEWTFMFHYQGRLTVVAGNRPMHYMKLDNGFMFNTSSIVLTHMKEWMLAYWHNKYSLGKIVTMKPHTMVSVAPGTRDLHFLDINSSPVDPGLGKWMLDDGYMNR